MALVAVATFGPALARRVPSLSALHLPGGVVATFERQQESFELDAHYAAELTSPAEWGPVIDDMDAGPPGAMPRPEEDPIELANEGIRVLGMIVGAFQVQLDFLRALGSAQRGLTHAAARQWFEDAIAAKSGSAADWDLDALINWLLNQGAIALDPDGTYRLTAFGQRVVGTLGLPGLFIEPKLV